MKYFLYFYVAMAIISWIHNCIKKAETEPDIKASNMIVGVAVGAFLQAIALYCVYNL